jgi:hypothetical protein
MKLCRLGSPSGAINPHLRAQKAALTLRFASLPVGHLLAARHRLRLRSVLAYPSRLRELTSLPFSDSFREPNPLTDCAQHLGVERRFRSSVDGFEKSILGWVLE